MGPAWIGQTSRLTQVHDVVQTILLGPFCELDERVCQRELQCVTQERETSRAYRYCSQCQHAVATAIMRLPYLAGVKQHASCFGLSW